MRDTVYQTQKSHIADFAFNQEVVDVFPDMIRRSVPGYETMIPVTGLIAARHLGSQGVAYDLGCSLGATTLAILSQNHHPEIRVVGVDNAHAMVAGAKNAIRDPRAQFIEQNLQDTSVQDAQVVLLNLVMQFLPPDERLPLLTRIRQEMSPNGILLVSEKVSDTNPVTEELFDTTHLAWKQANGYSNLEISQKRAALENVMIIDSEETHVERFNQAGFSQTIQWYRCLNWASFLVHP